MADFRLDTFKGIRPRVKARLLPEHEGQTASNARLGSGALEPWDDLTQVIQTSDGSTQSIFRMRNSGTPLWLESTNDVDYARGPVPDDALERIYYTGEAQPRFTTTDLVGATAPLPNDYYYLGIPAPTLAPTLTGDAVPDTTVTGTATAWTSNTLNADFTIEDNLPFNVTGWYMGNDTGYDASGTIRVFDFAFNTGKELEVVSVTDANTVVLQDANGANYIAATTQQNRVSQGVTHFRTEDTGTTRDGHFRFYLPNGTAFTLPAHGLQAGDVIRVSSVTTTPAVRFTQPASVAGGNELFQGWESDNGAGDPDTNTWAAAPVALSDDGFYISGSARCYPFEEIWIDGDGPGSSASFDVEGAFSWELIERDGASYAATAADVESRVYVFTYVSVLGEEGPPSDASSTITIPTDGSVTVTQTGTPPSTQRDIDFWRIYRANTGTEVTDFQFVAEVAIGTTTYADSLTDVELGEVLQTVTWDPPPAALEGMTAGPNGIMAGFIGKTIYLSEPYHPHAWPTDYKQAVDHDIVGIGVLPNGFAILTKGSPYALVGDHSATMSLQHFEFAQSCVSKRSIVNTLDSVLYASPDGLCEIGNRGFQIITKNYATKKEWQSYNPSSMKGFWHDNRYFGFHSGGGIIFDPYDPVVGLTTVTDTAITGYVEEENDTLYLLIPEVSTTALLVAAADTGTGNRMMTSTDGITWTSRANAADEAWVDLGFNSVTGEIIVATANNHPTDDVGESSTDGTTWADIAGWIGGPSPVGFNVHDIKYVNSLGRWVALGNQGGSVSIMWSDDGDSWNLESWLGSTGGLSFDQASDGTLYGFAADRSLYQSTDGKSWTFLETLSSGLTLVSTHTELLNCGSTMGWLLQTGAHIDRSTTDPGTTGNWSRVHGPDANVLNGMAYSPTLGTVGRAVVVGESGTVLTSDNGTTWTSRTAASANHWTDVVWDANLALFIAVSETGTGDRVMTSPDGITWTSRTSAADNDWQSIIAASTVTAPYINSWNTDAANPRTVTWKSGKIKCPYPLNLGACRIVADGTVTLNIWNDQGDLVVTNRSVTNDEVIRLPGGYMTSWFEIQVASTTDIEMVHVGETVEELLPG